MSFPVGVLEGGAAGMLATLGASGTGVMRDKWPIGSVSLGKAAVVMPEK